MANDKALALIEKPERLSRAGINHLNDYLQSLREGANNSERGYIPFYRVEEIEQGAPSILWMDKKGKFTRRLYNYFQKQYNTKLSELELEKIGNLFHQYSVKAEMTFLKTEALTWRAGKFGDNDSCYFQSRKCAKEVMKDMGMYAYTFYLEGVPQGRVIAYTGDNLLSWKHLIKDRKGEIIMNAYGISLEEAAACLTNDGDFMTVNLELEGGDEDGDYENDVPMSVLYINSEKGIVINSKTATKGRNTVIIPRGRGVKTCQECGNYFIYASKNDEYCGRHN